MNEPFALIALPSTTIEDSGSQIQKEGVTAIAQFLDAGQTRSVFHVDLRDHRIQPILIMIRNDSDQGYLFNKANVDGRYFPAARVARLAQVSSVVIAVRYLKWLTWLVPGFVFDTVIEPASTLDFPGIQEAAQRPPRSHRHEILEDFLSHEILDGQIEPQSSRAGVMFIHPQRLGGTLPMGLINVSTGQRVEFDIPTPPPRYIETHNYPQPYDVVWETAVKVSAGIRAWRVASADKSHGVLAVHTGMTFLMWSTAARITVTLRAVNDRTTQVTVESTLRRVDSLEYGQHSKTIDRFFEELGEVLIKPGQPLPPDHPGFAPPAVPQPSSSEGQNSDAHQRSLAPANAP